MRLPRFLIEPLRRWLLTRHGLARRPDFQVGGPADPYLNRWFVIPRNRWFNVYLHEFKRDDDDRALHDHPWWWCSVMLYGAYHEHTIAAGGIHRRRFFEAPGIRFGGPTRAHRIELLRMPFTDAPAPCWTLFITGPRMRMWGFHCPDAGWIPYHEFTDPTDTGQTGRGCDQ